jgi:uncharacterized membrane protein
MRLPVWITLAAALALAVLVPVIFGQIMVAGLAKLHLSPQMAVALVIAIIFGGFVNFPLKRIVRGDDTAGHPLTHLGFDHVWPRARKVRRETVIAVNLGGCVIPAGLAVYELFHLAAYGPETLWLVIAAAAANIYICYIVARPIPEVGIVIPGLVPPLVAAALALLLGGEAASPFAFVVGIAGPLIGADLLHLKEIEETAVGVASIGGAGTFDGIVLSGILAAYIA